MRFIRPKGSSFTTPTSAESSTSAENLNRNLRLKGDNDDGTPQIVTGDELPDFLATDHILLLGQFVSEMDKALRKPKSFRECDLDTYLHRARLGAALWTQFAQIINSEALSSEYLESLQEKWCWKVHPYAPVKVTDFAIPQLDSNADLLQKRPSEKQTKFDYKGRWFKVFFKDSFPLDYEAAARAIRSHILSQERKIDGGERRTQQKPGKRGDLVASKKGLANSRGERIAKSANDPRKASSGSGARESARQNAGNIDAQKIYKAPDIAADILRQLIDLQTEIASKETETAKRCAFGKARPSAICGRALYDHFGQILKEQERDPAQLDQLWKLHNRIRTFYKKATKSQGFRLAMLSGDPKELEKQVPRDCLKLFAKVRAKSENQEVNRLIRLGKLIVHASDFQSLPHNTDKTFQDRLSYFSCSEGQSEIKRKEAFTRVWRNAVGLTFRTLKSWADPLGEAAVIKGNQTKPDMDGGTRSSAEESYDLLEASLNRDLSTPAVAVRALGKKIFNPEHFRRHVELVFGSKKIPVSDGKKSRAELFSPQRPEEQKELLWGMLRLAGEIRNRTNHFTTMSRLVGVVTNPPLLSLERPPSFGERSRRQVSKTALDAFEQLLAFDVALQRQILLDTLEQLKIDSFLDEEERVTVLGEMAKASTGSATTLPKFISMVGRANGLATSATQHLHDSLKPFKVLDLHSLSQKHENQPSSHQDVAMCQIGLLRQLYSSGFSAWLNPALQADPGLLQKAVQAIVGGRNSRTQEYNEGLGRAYALPESLADQLDLWGVTDIDGLFGQLHSRAMSESGINKGYNAPRNAQRTQTSWIEEFKQEVVAFLFSHYLKKQKLDWIWGLACRVASPEPLTALEPSGIDVASPVTKDEGWHRQFYAWLYLVPPDEAAMLRHQIMKTLVLERKGDGEDAAPSQALSDIIALMGLYTKVQSAGFSGEEHFGHRAAHDKAEGGLLRPELFYESEAQFKEVFSDAHKDREITFPGTRRGLREILRFGSLGVLTEILGKHRMSKDEIEAFIRRSNASPKANSNDWDPDWITQRKILRDTIVKFNTSRDKSNNEEIRDKLRAAAQDYRRHAIAIQQHTFLANGSRLTEFANLHQLLMRIVGRLTDFALIWERDRTYLMLGMLWDQQGGLDLEAEEIPVSGQKQSGPSEHKTIVGIKLSPEQVDELSFIKDSSDTRHLVAAIQRGILPLWSLEDGFSMLTFDLFEGLLSKAPRQRFHKYFIRVDEENPKDVEANERRKKSSSGDSHKRPALRTSKRGRTKVKIRDDLAHYNVLEQNANELKLTYIINAVRSLLSYDRKRKNDVVRAIKDVLRGAGLNIAWKFAEDRLTRPMVTPNLEWHLQFLKDAKLRDDLGFALPQASMRYASMVQALFDGGSNGHLGKPSDSERQLQYPDTWTDLVKIPKALSSERVIQVLKSRKSASDRS